MLNIIRTFLILIYIVILQGYFFAHPVSAKLNNVILERVTVEDGLSQATVMALAQDKQGYIWFGTENGINIYDGYNISSLAGPDKNFHKFSVNTIYVASDGLVWISLFGEGHHLMMKSLMFGRLLKMRKTIAFGLSQKNP